jgi:hypothetical protein
MKSAPHNCSLLSADVGMAPIRDVWNLHAASTRPLIALPMSDGKPAKGAAGCQLTAVRRSHMSDYRDSNDPMYGYEPPDRIGIWGWAIGWLRTLKALHPHV